MKTNKFLILLLPFFCQCASDSMINGTSDSTLRSSCESCLPDVSDKYTYPIVPGMIEWNTSEDVFPYVQLPEDVLKSISTLGLIDALVKAPLFSGLYMLSSSPPIDTWHRHYDRFNSATELFNRKDAGDELIKYYKVVCFDYFNSNDENFRPFEMSERIFGLEFLFTKQEILDKISHQKKQALVADILSKYKQPDFWADWIEHWRIGIPLAFIMKSDDFSPMVKYYQDNADISYGYISKEQLDTIISYANDYVQ
jgi:hypothetical protein